MNPKIAFGLFLLLVAALILTACKITGGTVSEPDIEECQSLTNLSKDNCYLDHNKCSKIQESWEEQRKKEIALQLVLNQVHPEQIAEILNAHDLCEGIEDTYWNDICHHNLGVANNKDTYCALVSDEEQKEDCLFQVAIATNNTVLCEFLSTEKMSNCLFKVAVNMKEVMICQELPSVISRDSCRVKVAEASCDKAICELIGTGLIKENCLKRVNDASCSK